MLKDGVCVAPESVRSSLEIGNEEGVLIRVQDLSVGLFVRGEPVELASYLVYASPNKEEEDGADFAPGWQQRADRSVQRA